MKKFRILLLMSGFVLLSVQSEGALAAVAGHVQFVHGVVQITTPGGQVRTAQKGDAVNEGDILTSAEDASAQVRMQDGGFIAVRPETRMKFDQFRFSGKEDGEERGFFSLFKGGFRAVTGLIGRINKQNYKITTPSATIGIRGTDHESYEVTPGSAMAQVAPVGAYSKVNTGGTTMTTDQGTINVQPNQMGFAAGMNQAPVVQQLNTNIFTVAPAPAEETKLEKKEEKPAQQAASGGEATGAAGSGTEQTESAQQEPVRDTAVVDATPPAAGVLPAATTPVVAGGAAGTTVSTPVATTVAPPTVLPVDGQTVNLNNQTITTTATGQTTTVTGNMPTYAASNGYGYEVLGVDPATGAWANPFATNLPATSYLLDAGNNLVEVVGQGKISGGVAKDTYVSADGSVYFGRWQGGVVAFTAPAGSNFALGNTSLQWVFSANPPVGYVQTLAGLTNYSLTAATHPTDRFGNVGTLTAATLSADFTNQIVNISLALSFSTADPNFISTQNKAFTVTTPNGIPISGDNIWMGGINGVTCTGVNCDAAGYTADIWARFAANAADKVAIPYNIVGNSTDVVQGVAMVTAATPPLVIPPVASAPFVQTDLAVAVATTETTSVPSPAYTTVNTLIAKPADVNNTLPSPSFTDRFVSNGPATYSLSGAVAAQPVTTIAATGIQFGQYSATSAQYVLGAGNPTSSGRPVYSHWIGGPAVTPVYLPEVLLTTNAAYTFAGGTTPTSTIAGAAATLNSASLSVNFSLQVVNFNLALSVGGTPWSAVTTGAGVPLEIMYFNSAKVGFRATTMARPGWSSALSVMVGTSPASGEVAGQLTGNALNGAILSYALSNFNMANSTVDQVAGVAAFTGTAQNTATPYRIAALSTIDTVIPATGPSQLAPVTMGGYNNSGRVLFDAAGNATQFDTDKSFTNGVGTVTVSPAAGTTVAGLGTDPISGISWGRWVGTVLMTDRVTNTTTSLNANGTSHWITGPVMTGPVALPVSGTYNYVLAGGTAPTDSLGGVGTLNSATLSANFTTQTVNLGVNVTTPNAGNLVASGTNIPIEQKSFFGAATANSPSGGPNVGALTVTCPAGCAGALSGHVGGVFTGAGGLGAGMLYGLQNGSVSVNGVTAFHR
ncbi:hypothetical protein FGKAn22_16820 [Ferrigenium kumadai]|uniref:FecR protein domain-containing protein n=1 Tax=Ferrigenium kumadai TaxID=1682490 RepID=A0AAN1T1R2_9PROT|nr:FecR domain-containing protein [Ferrigenium kumadai]BBI99989.1 hypothetical protein FGKAn22_16820 [Ferrigenium kumadai]